MREEMHLSKKYVAGYLGMTEEIFGYIEQNETLLTEDMIEKLSELYGVSKTTLRLSCGTVLLRPDNIPNYDDLSMQDKIAISNLMHFRNSLRPAYLMETQY